MPPALPVGRAILELTPPGRVALMPARPIAPVLITIYVCVGTLQPANVRSTFGPVGRLVVSPAYHRLHHDPGVLRANLGVVLTV